MAKPISVYEQSNKYVITCVEVIVHNESGEILLTKRAKEPFFGSWILPGGHLKIGEEPKDAAEREVYEETGLLIKVERLYGVYATPGRDPRMQTASIVFVALATGGEIIKTVEVSQSCFLVRSKIPTEIGFDHQRIIDDFFACPNGQPV